MFNLTHKIPSVQRNEVQWLITGVWKSAPFCLIYLFGGIGKVSYVSWLYLQHGCRCTLPEIC